ncbi:dATP/dGTP diphosphohydrolase domain-containing protein [Acinetobacter haemolyticus]|uniref:dATP/dGTP diphosphohydrolase domain-containing protein n=1 Tax=Acinetobacter haemolyticus TaxID=29430 RepID=UPI0009493CB6|nr:dATP/dGTP diphosphohydrolase domain-containing protein [Acinetobacter haemolyticus]APR70749.1 hypothetical protein AHTJS_10460 [Acinetobacter haemolyticus]
MTTKHDQSKPRFSLIPVGTLSAVVRVLEFGAGKYAESNWQTVPDARRRYYDAMHRHIDAWWQGEKKDSETGESHLAHAVCCALFLMWLDDNSKRDTEACSWKNESLMTQLESITKRDKEQSQ